MDRRLDQMQRGRRPDLSSLNSAARPVLTSWGRPGESLLTIRLPDWNLYRAGPVPPLQVPLESCQPGSSTGPGPRLPPAQAAAGAAASGA